MTCPGLVKGACTRCDLGHDWRNFASKVTGVGRSIICIDEDQPGDKF